MSITEELSMDLTQTISVQASAEATFDALIRRLTTESASENNQPMPMVLEQRPGGRWYRDLGGQQGHLWGFVQVIKPPTLLEIHGPMFMSYAVAGHLQLRVIPADDGGVELSLRHRVLGILDERHREGLTHGWTGCLTDVQRMAQQ